MRILAVDDDPVFLELLAGMLKAIGYGHVTTVGTAEQALHEVDTSNHVYDCILSDMQMPGLDGTALTTAIRLRTAYRQTPILMITALAGKNFVDEAFTAGATDYITKPFRKAELIARVRTHLALKTSREARQAAEQIGRQRAELSPAPPP